MMEVILLLYDDFFFNVMVVPKTSLLTKVLKFQWCRTRSCPTRLERQTHPNALALSSLHHGKTTVSHLPWFANVTSRQPRRAIILRIEGNVGYGKSTLLKGPQRNGFPVSYFPWAGGWWMENPTAAILFWPRQVGVRVPDGSAQMVSKVTRHRPVDPLRRHDAHYRPPIPCIHLREAWYTMLN